MTDETNPATTAETRRFLRGAVRAVNGSSWSMSVVRGPWFVVRDPDPLPGSVSRTRITDI